MHVLILSFALSFLVPSAFAADATAADLDALDRLECFSENPLVHPEDDLALIAILPDAHVLFGSRVAGSNIRLTRTLRGRFVGDDLSAGENLTDREPANVLRVTVRRRGRGCAATRDERRRRFTAEVERLRARYPHAKLSCVYDVAEYARIRACTNALGG